MSNRRIFVVHCRTGTHPSFTKEFGWKFGGCSDNFSWGSQVAESFLDDIVDREGSVEDAARAVRLHNIKAGMVVS